MPKTNRSEDKTIKEVTIHTDGACSGNPGIGGWAAVLEYNEEQRTISGGVDHTTNNHMEIMPAIDALRSLKLPCNVDPFNDTSYLRDGISSWVHRWRKNGWKTAAKKPVKNKDLWQELLQVSEIHQIQWHWVKGHNGNPQNEECDRLAREEIDNIRS